MPHAYRALDALHAGRHRLRRMVAINLATILRTQGDVEASRAVLAAAEASAQAASDLDALVLQMEQQFRHGQLIHAAQRSPGAANDGATRVAEAAFGAAAGPSLFGANFLSME